MASGSWKFNGLGGVCVQQPWFQVFADLPGHKKICKLRDGLKLKSRYEAVGLVICIWAWAAVHAPSGDLAGVSAQDLADAAGWRKSAKGLEEALVASGLVDRTEDGLSLHDWDDHQGMLQDALAESRRKNAERVRRHRAKRRAEQQEATLPSTPLAADAPCNGECNVTERITERITGNGGNAPTSTITNTITSLSECGSSPTPYDGVTPDGGDGDRDILRIVGGDVGQGVLLLSDRQMEDLLERMGVDGFNAYGPRLIDFVRRTGANIDHYYTLLKWWKEDRPGGGASP